MCINNDEFRIKNEELLIKTEELCIQNDEFCIKSDPAERTLLVTGAIDLVMQSRARAGAVLETPPELAGLRYAAPAKEAIRPSAELPSGASLVPFDVEPPTEYVLVPKM